MLNVLHCLCDAEEVQVRLREVDGRVSVAFTAPGPTSPEGSEGPATRPQPSSPASGTPPVPGASDEARPQSSGYATVHPHVVMWRIYHVHHPLTGLVTGREEWRLPSMRVSRRTVSARAQCGEARVNIAISLSPMRSMRHALWYVSQGTCFGHTWHAQSCRILNSTSPECIPGPVCGSDEPL